MTEDVVIPTFKSRGYLVLRASGRNTLKVSATVGACSECGALVEDGEHEPHVLWHLRMTSALRASPA